MKPSKKGRVLIVDDEVDIQEELEDWFEAQGFDVVHASNGMEGLQRIRTEPLDLVILDLQMPGMDGMAVLRQIEAEGIDTTVVVITAYGSVERAVQAMKAGAFDFIPKPFETEHLRVVVEKAMERERLRREHAYLQEEAAGAVPALIGNSPKMRDILAVAQRAAQSTTTILLRGESGTGKEVLARAIHHWSPRQDRPFVAVNCVALAESLLESELFGHEKGAFTNAYRQKKGRFELARGGTILLDEIGAMKPDAQLKLLRVIQEGEFERVGSDHAHAIKADVRVIAATNRNLEQAIVDSTFLQDLYYRLNDVSIVLPPLRERKEDIPALAQFFLQKYAHETKREVTGISDVAMAYLTASTWPGNIRELENAIERAVVLSPGPEIRPKDLPEQIVGTKVAPTWETTVASLDEWLHAMMQQDRGETVRNFLETMEEMAIRVAVAHTKGNKSKAAALLGLDRKQVERRMRKYEIDGTASDH
ncbi:MAG: sigma-54-dependent Fis family transcriptional regulator [Candidatus Latescibacteria bacterium]|nr:sigma-54-dependent Fis family transcriptional regulator [Candidatus Latescibacterota bacterium]